MADIPAAFAAWLAANPSPVCAIDATGIHRPEYATVLAWAQAGYRFIYGVDTILDADTQDGQWVTLIALAFHDANGAVVQAYNARTPAEAQGAGLSSLVKLNGLSRKAATFSTVDLTLIGQSGVQIAAGLVSDGTNEWALPAMVVIPSSGTITVTAICLTLGAVTLPARGIDTANGVGSLETIVPGFQSATNLSPATPGQPVETDAQLRARQAISTALPSQSLFEGLVAAVAAVSGVTRLRGYENDTNAPDANGIPGHAVCLVVDGGDASQIAGLIARKKGNAGTWGTTQQTVTDATGTTRTITFSRPTAVPLSFALKVRSLGGYTQGVDARVKAALVSWATALGIGNSARRDAAYLPAKLNGDALAQGYEIVSLAMGRDGMPATERDVLLAYDEAATSDPTLVTITVVP